MSPPHSEPIRFIPSKRKGIIMAAASLKDVAAFLRKDGESLTDFSKEWKSLSETDKEQIKEGIGNGTLTY